jgi:hypothetical protein
VGLFTHVVEAERQFYHTNQEERRGCDVQGRRI